MKTIRDYMLEHPTWFDGSPTTEKKIRTAIESGKINARKVKGSYRIDERYAPKEGKSGIGTGARLKDAHLAVKIKREQQQLYDQRLLFVEKIKDIFLQEYHLPRMAGLTEVIRKHGNMELFEKWNQEIKNGSTENLENLVQALRDVILN